MAEHSSSPLSSTHSELDILRTISEKKIEDYEPGEGEIDERTQKVLKGFIDNLPEDGAINICNDINDCKNNDELHQLAAHLFEAILKPMRGRPKSPTPELPPRIGAFQSTDEMVAELPETHSRVQQAKLRKFCLLRDDNRCVITGAFDNKVWAKLPLDQRKPGVRTSPTEAAHIFPFALGKYDDLEVHATSVIWGSLYRCFPSIKVHPGLDIDSINATFNAMILSTPLHQEFGNFSLAFEATDTINTYRLRRYESYSSLFDFLLPASGLVTFVAHHGAYELPAPNLLRAHAALAKILHATGMGEYIEKALLDREELKALAEDGSTNVRRLLLAF